MDFKKEFQRIMENAVELSLATSDNNIPNVRILTFYYDEQKMELLILPPITNHLK